MAPEADDLERLDYSRRADRLGLPFTPATPLDELRAMVTARESEMSNKPIALVNGQWEINGDIPNGLTFVNGQFATPSGQTQPDCFGELWDGAAGGAEDCAKCVFSPVCQEAMAKITFTAARASAGPGVGLKELAVLCDVSEQSVLVLMAQQAGQASATEAPKKKKKPPVEVAPVVPVAVTPEAVASIPALTTPEVQAEVAATVPVDAPPTEAPKPKAKPAKKGKAKAAKTAEPSVAPVPREARPVKRAKAGARARKAKSAQTAKARVGAPLGKKWGEGTWLARWNRERQRTPSLRRAVPGSVIQVERAGQTYRVQVFKGYYLFNGQKVPTLCEAAKLATGTTNWSAERFWFPSKTQSLPAQPSGT